MDNKELFYKLKDKYNKEGKIVFMTIDGMVESSIENLLNQPIEGLLYDLNRDEATLATQAENTKNQRFINDYALTNIVRYLLNERNNSQSNKPQENTTKNTPKQPKVERNYNNPNNFQEGFDTTFSFNL